MPGASAATKSRRCGSRPNEPAGVSATMRETSPSSTKTWNGSSTLSRMGDGGIGGRLLFRVRRRLRLRVCLRIRLRLRLWLRLDLRLVDRPDHVERALRHVVELVMKDPLASVERVLQADELARQAGELLGREERLRQEALE